MTLPSSDITTTPDPDTAPLRQYALTDNLAADSQDGIVDVLVVVRAAGRVNE